MSHSTAGVPDFLEPSQGREWRANMEHVRSKVVVKADIMPAISILFMISLAGIPLGWLWSRMAPPQHTQVVSASGNTVPLPLESWHQFDALAIFVALSFGLGALLGVGGWLLRQRRGPIVLAGIAMGSAAAGWLAAMMGHTFAQGRYSTSNPPGLGDTVVRPPETGPWWLLFISPLAVCAVYGVLALWNGREDLGRRLG